MKRITTMLLCAAMLLSLAACSREPAGSTPEGSGSAAVSSDADAATSGDDTVSGEPGSDVSADGTTPSNSGTPSNGGNATKKPGTSSQSAGPRQVVNNCYTTGYPIAKDPVTFKIMIRDHANGLAKYNDSPLVKYIKDKMNITLSFESVPPTDMVGQKMTTA